MAGIRPETQVGRKAVEQRVRAWCTPEFIFEVATVWGDEDRHFKHQLRASIGGQVVRTMEFRVKHLEDSRGASAVQQVDHELLPPCNFVTREIDDVEHTCGRPATYRVANAPGIADEYLCEGHARDVEDGGVHPVLCFRPPPPLPGP